ncbi:MAG: hypothetical protein HDT44_07195 [Ruminococcaceae bacterium]|nr:hypothetical protein [Oscillospiraceae bacterium]
MENEIKVPRMETIKTTAQIFNLPVHFVRCKVASGDVVAVRAGKRFLVNVDKFAEYLNTSTISTDLTDDEAAKNSRVSPINLRR